LLQSKKRRLFRLAYGVLRNFQQYLSYIVGGLFYWWRKLE
jgi:hypothetical protein